MGIKARERELRERQRERGKWDESCGCAGKTEKGGENGRQRERDDKLITCFMN